MSSIGHFKVKFQSVQYSSPCQSDLKGHQHKRLVAKTDPQQTGCLQRAGKKSITADNTVACESHYCDPDKIWEEEGWTQRAARALWRQSCLLSCWITLRCSVWSGHRSDVSLSSWTHWPRFMWRRRCLDVPVRLRSSVSHCCCCCWWCCVWMSLQHKGCFKCKLAALKRSFTEVAFYLQDFWKTSLIWLSSPNGKWHPALHVVWFPFVWGY